MKSTSALRALCRADLGPNQLSIHPNDGFDLGLMTTGYEVELEGSVHAQLRLRNDCPKASVELPLRLYESLGKPSMAVLRYDGTKLFIEPC